MEERTPTATSDHSETLQIIVDFLASIGLPVGATELDKDTFLPGIEIVEGELYIDETRLAHPGDLLHEAGHVAVVPAVERHTLTGNVDRGGGDEMMAIAWSWAALTHLRLPPEVVFHFEGYKGDSEWIIEIFSGGSYFGLPLLQWAGMTVDPSGKNADEAAVFPKMIKWLRD